MGPSSLSTAPSTSRASRTRLLLVLLSAAAAAAARYTPGGAPACASTLSPSQLRADGRLGPSLGTSPAPLFAWSAPNAAAFSAVAAVRVQLFDALAGAAAAPLWDSGDVPTGSSGATPWSLPYGGAAPLRPAHPFRWRAAVQGGGAPAGGEWSAWSANATLVAAPAPGAAWPAPAVEPVWAANASAQLVLLRAALRVPAGRSVAAAYAFAVAQPQRSAGDAENGKLLGAYKLFVGGALAGMGPGRPGRCGPVCPVSHSPGTCSCAPEQLYDVLDVTDALSAAAGAGGGGEAVLALQCFHDAAHGPDAARVQLLVQATLDDGNVISVGTAPGAGAGWLALDATAWMRPGCCTESAWFFGPSENWDARLEPVGWRLPSFAPSAAWAPPAAAGAFFAPLAPKPTLALATVEGLAPAAVRSPAPGVTVLDFGRELQGGLAVALGAATPAGASLAIQLGEELQADGTVRFEMRTGNNYSGVVTTRAGAQVFETHEYLEFRYAQVVELGRSVGGPPCAESGLGDYSTPLTLRCAGDGNTITKISFASWGTPSGACLPDGSGNSFAVNASCAYAGTLGVLRPLCVGRGACTFTPSDALFGDVDPCHLVDKQLAVAWACAAPPPPPPPALDVSVTAWQVSYPASFAGDAADACEGGAAATGEAGGSLSGGQFASSSADLDAVFALCEYTIRAVNLDLVTDSNTRQRSPVCAEAMLATSVNQAYSSFETASQDFLTRYVVNGSPGGAGWAEWQALLISSVHELWLATGDLSFFVAQRAQLEAFLERELFDPASGLWACPSAHIWGCQQPEVDWPIGMRDGFVSVPANSVVSSHYVGALREYAAMAEAAGDAAAAAAARANATALAAAMRRQLYNASAGAAGAIVDGLGTSHAAIHSSAYALARGVADGDDAMGAALWATLLARLDPEAGIPVGPYPGLFFGTALFRNTSDHGRAAVARFLVNNGTNSWLNQLRQGATTTMESWTVAEKSNLTWSEMAIAGRFQPTNRHQLTRARTRPIDPVQATPGWPLPYSSSSAGCWACVRLRRALRACSSSRSPAHCSLRAARCRPCAAP